MHFRRTLGSSCWIALKRWNRSLGGGGKIQAYLLVFSVQIVFAGYQLFAETALTEDGVDPLVFALIRVVGTTVLLFSLSSCCTPHARLLPRWGDKTYFVLLGCCMVANVLGLIAALKLTTNATVAFLQVMRPVFASFVSWVMGLEQFTIPKVLGIIICIAGTLRIATAESQAWSTSDSPTLGILCVCIHSVGQSSYVLLQPSLLNTGYSPMVINACSFLVAATVLVILFPFIPHRGAWWQWSISFMTITLWSIFLVGAYSYVAMGWAAKKIGGTAVMLFMLLQAIFTVVGGSIFLGEVIVAAQLQGGFVITLGFLIFVLSEDSPKTSSEIETHHNA